MSKFFALALLITTAAHSVSAQPSEPVSPAPVHPAPVRSQLLATAPYVFLGVVIDTSTFTGNDGVAYVSETCQIIWNFRGQRGTKTGLIEVIEPASSYRAPAQPAGAVIYCAGPTELAGNPANRQTFSPTAPVRLYLGNPQAKICRLQENQPLYGGLQQQFESSQAAWEYVNSQPGLRPWRPTDGLDAYPFKP